jgi:hypothetical protein
MKSPTLGTRLIKKIGDEEHRAEIRHNKEYDEFSGKDIEKKYEYDEDGNPIYYKEGDDVTRFIHHPKEGRLTVYSNDNNRENFSIYDERGVIVRERHIYKGENIEDNLVYNNSWLKYNWKRRMISDT